MDYLRTIFAEKIEKELLLVFNTYLLHQMVRQIWPEDDCDNAEYHKERAQAKDPDLALSCPATPTAHGGWIMGIGRFRDSMAAPKRCWASESGKKQSSQGYSRLHNQKDNKLIWLSRNFYSALPIMYPDILAPYRVANYTTLIAVLSQLEGFDKPTKKID